MTTESIEKTASTLLELLATVAVGDLVMRLNDSPLRDLYAKMMARAVELRDAAAERTNR